MEAEQVLAELKGWLEAEEGRSLCLPIVAGNARARLLQQVKAKLAELEADDE